MLSTHLAIAVENRISYDWDSWRRVLTTHLGIILQAATSTRVGEILRSDGYEGDQFLKWGDIELGFQNLASAPTVELLLARVKIRYDKGKK